ncbi:MAG: 4Fe-4S dicluster domain-containing protein [Melioribacteraceae bacterium]|jgi:2-oxoglutarate ferredoxin oxidoreductase subunit delta|nr:4Fe-4S dicluster domain-containing protein [Melioribacteraceae bacterium]
MAKAKGNIIIDIEKCKGCEICMDACPEDVIAMSKEVNNKGYLYAVKIEDSCTGCTNCALVCPDAVITVYREVKKKKEQVAKITNVTGNITVTVDK